MKNQILDYFGDSFDEGTKIVTVKYFYFESEARLNAARLKKEGINCFVSNTNAITAFPLAEGGIGLHVKEKDLERATEIVMEMHENKISEPDQDFNEADLDEIEYQKALNEPPIKPQHYIFLAIIVLLILLGGIFL